MAVVGNGVCRHFLGLFAGVLLPNKLATAGFVEPIFNRDGHFSFLSAGLMLT